MVIKQEKKVPTRAPERAAERAESPQGWLPGYPPGERVPGGWFASFTLPSAVHGEVGKSATSVGLRAPAGRFDAAQGESIDTGGGRRAVSSRRAGDRRRQVARARCQATLRRA